MKAIKKVPLAVCGLSLALAVLGNLLVSDWTPLRTICGVISAALWLVFLLKVVFDFKTVREELKTPVVLSILPTSTMALMLLCTYAKPHFGAAVYIWYAAVVAHLLIMLLFVKRFFLGFKLQSVFPSWFLVCVGIVTASVTSPAMDAKPLGQVFLWIGLALYVLVLPLVFYRLIKARPLPKPSLPTMAIFAAPMSLCIVGYFSCFEQIEPALVYVMLAIAAVSYIFALICILTMLKMEFYPTFAAFTFPMVISAVAFKNAAAFLANRGYTFLSFAPVLSKWIAIVAVVYVLGRYTVYLIRPAKTTVSK